MENHLSDFRKYFVDKYYPPEWLDEARNRYASANPFPHIIIDDFLPSEVLDEVLVHFDTYDERN